jgi:oligosaccharyltransferase complex subunit delta (ribophorin II)
MNSQPNGYCRVHANSTPRLIPHKSLSKPVQLGSSDTLKILLTVKEDKKVKRPHQAFLLLEDPATGLDTSFPLSVKENGKAKVELVCSRLFSSG